MHYQVSSDWVFRASPTGTQTRTGTRTQTGTETRTQTGSAQVIIDNERKDKTRVEEKAILYGKFIVLFHETSA